MNTSKIPALVGCLCILIAHGHDARASNALSGSNRRLFDRSTMTSIDLNGLRVRLGEPVQVTAQIGFSLGWDHPSDEPAWSFIHLTPYLARFPEGNLLATYTMDPDTQDNPFFLSAYQISDDGGARWGRRYAVLIQHVCMVFLPKPNDSLLGIPSEFMPSLDGNDQEMAGPAYLFTEGGKHLLFTPDAVKVVGWPYPLEGAQPSPQPSDNWHMNGVTITGNSLEVRGRLLSTAYDWPKGSKYLDTVIVTSDDGGYTWRYFSTIAKPNLERDGKKPGYEGPNEPAMIELADGDLMAVVRIGSGLNLLRSCSHDGGRTWSEADPIPPWSVDPQLKRIANGTIVLSTGRPGIRLWLSGDPGGENWQSIDVVAFHNSRMIDPSMRISEKPSKHRHHFASWQTSAYTGLVEIAPNRLILLYDRDPEGAPSGPKDISRLFVVPVEVERN